MREERPTELEVATALGRTVREFSRLESQISFFIWSLLGTQQEIGHRVTSLLAFRQLCRLFVSLIELRVPVEPFVSELKALMKRAGSLNERRNELMHSVYTRANEQTGTVGRLKYTLSPEGARFENLSPTEVNEVASDISALHDDLDMWHTRASLAVPDFPGVRIISS
jgi:hypothetical protein